MSGKDEKPDYYDAVLKRLETLKQTGNEFNEASRDRSSENKISGIDSEQVKNSAPSVDLKPKGPDANEIAKQAHNDAMAKDDARAKSYNERLENLNNSKYENNDVKSKDENSKN